MKLWISFHPPSVIALDDVSLGGGPPPASTVGIFSEIAGASSHPGGDASFEAATACPEAPDPDRWATRRGTRLRPCTSSGGRRPLIERRVGMRSIVLTVSSIAAPDGIAPGLQRINAEFVSSP